MADEHFGNIGLADLCTGQVDPGVALVTLYHGAASEGLHAETGDKIPGIIIWKGTTVEKWDFLRPSCLGTAHPEHSE